ncbi:dephospho-CoA kinase [Treponema sp.]|uniref:dephospho-CoA kinase n=1 Tax=Treponema sp. TaxID=166 RepID=UPI00298E2C38|nr:dephospho-CoA kinase [Treponema sp.]MCR5614330.1 dephospho-CoA kinase [Treponema sp.]
MAEKWTENGTEKKRGDSINCGGQKAGGAESAQKKKVIRRLNKILCANSDARIICLTGKMASGKNFVASCLEDLGFVSIDLDKEVHKVIEQKKDVIFERFEKAALEEGIKIRVAGSSHGNSDSSSRTDSRDHTGDNFSGNSDTDSLDRRALGRYLFKSPELLEKQESIIYPALTSNVLEFIAQKKSQPGLRGIVINATVLYKTPSILNKCDMIIFVQSNTLTRLRRAKKRDNSPTLQLLSRFKAQKNLKDKYIETGIKVVTIYN